MNLLIALFLSATPCKDATFWTSEAVLPLVVVRNGKIEADIGQCSRDVELHEDGVRWKAIDRWGKQVGTVANVNDEKHGTAFKTVTGNRGTGVYVRGVVPTFKSASWSPDVETRKSLVLAVGQKVQKEAKDVAFFKTDGGDEYAVVAGRSSLLVMTKKGESWKRVFRTTQKAPEWNTFSIKAIVDMDDDGVPEIIYHYAAQADGTGHEVVVGKNSKGRWKELANNEDNGP